MCSCRWECKVRNRRNFYHRWCRAKAEISSPLTARWLRLLYYGYIKKTEKVVRFDYPPQSHWITSLTRHGTLDTLKRIYQMHHTVQLSWTLHGGAPRVKRDAVRRYVFDSVGSQPSRVIHDSLPEIVCVNIALHFHSTVNEPSYHTACNVIPVSHHISTKKHRQLNKGARVCIPTLPSWARPSMTSARPQSPMQWTTFESSACTSPRVAIQRSRSWR